MLAFPERLKTLRRQKDLSQRELARTLHMGVSTIAMYEVGSREPDFETITKFADFFMVSTDYLLGRTDDPQSEAGSVARATGDSARAGAITKGNGESEKDQGTLIAVFRGGQKVRELRFDPAFEKTLIAMMEAAHKQMAEEKEKDENGKP